MKLASTRVAFMDGLTKLATENPNVVLVCADSTKVIKSDAYAEMFPDRIFDVGIAEQNALLCAAGLASCNLIPFVATYAGFITMRACEQVRTFVAYPNLNVKMVGVNGGIAAGEREGVSHQFYEDVGIIRTIPGITIVVPADSGQVEQAVAAIAKVDGPAYLRIGSGRDPIIFSEAMAFELGKVRILKQTGLDVAIFTYGSMISRVLESADVLAQEGIGVCVVEVHTLKPIDVGGIVSILNQTSAAVTVEDHSTIGGLGSVIAEVSTENVPVPLVRLGIKDVFTESGEPEELLDKYGLSVADIVNAVKQVQIKKEK